MARERNGAPVPTPIGSGTGTLEAEHERLLGRRGVENYDSFDHPNGDHKQEDSSQRIKLWRSYLTADVDTQWADLVLILLFFVAGLAHPCATHTDVHSSIDAGAYNAWECFVSMQTGNTIFAALGISNLPVAAPKLAWTKSVTAIFSFLFGAATTSYFHRALGPRKRWVLAFSFLVQTLLVALAALMVGHAFSEGSPVKHPSVATAGLPSDPGFKWGNLITIALLSFGAAGKIVASRVLQYNALPTVVLTTLMNDLMSDPSLLTAGLWDNVQRNRRLGSLVMYFGGAASGGAVIRSALGFSGLLWIAAGIKFIIAIAWLLWRQEEHDVDSEDQHP